MSRLKVWTWPRGLDLNAKILVSVSFNITDKYLCIFVDYQNCLFVCLFVYLLPSLLSSFFMLSSLLIHFLTRLLPDLSIYFFQNKPVPFPDRRSLDARRPNLALVFWVHFTL